MKRLYVLTGLAIIGVAIALFVVVDSNRAPPTDRSDQRAETSPFASYVAGTGLTETGRGNVAIATGVPGIVSSVSVRVGDRVGAGDPLFEIDDRDLQARLQVARANVAQAEAALARPQHRLQFLLNLQARDRAAISREAVSNARDDLATAASALSVARAVVDQTQVDKQRLLVRAPTAGRVLQVNTRVGEFAASDGSAKPLMLLGDDSRMYLRLDIDENDAWRVRADAPAQAFVRGNPHVMIPLHFEYIEPYVTPKTSLTGQSTERSDLRVLQVVYSFEPKAMPVYLGQQMDAFIQAPAAAREVANGQR